jgi:hypothetical protein
MRRSDGGNPPRPTNIIFAYIFLFRMFYVVEHAGIHFIPFFGLDIRPHPALKALTQAKHEVEGR